MKQKEQNETSLTERLYEDAPMCETFTARVVACVARGTHYGTVLDRTAFFPEGGGQDGDSGLLNGIAVYDTVEENGTILHVTAQPFQPGEAVEGHVDFGKRFPRMQCHTAEHIVSGLFHARYGCNNVGFHLSDREVTLDVDKPLEDEEIAAVEQEANRVIWQNLPVRILYPEPEALEKLDYRSKLELVGRVRLVEIPGYDLCACCAPHVERTGAIGQVKLISSMHYKGGMRLWLLAGARALSDYSDRVEQGRRISQILSVPQEKIAAGVLRLNEEAGELRRRLAAQFRKINAMRKERLTPAEGNILIFETDMEGAEIRDLVQYGMSLCGGLCGLFVERAEGFSYCIGSMTHDLRPLAGQLNAALSGKGGGSATMIQGSVRADRAAVRAFWNGLS